MGKWLVGGAVALVVICILIWQQLGESEATPEPEIKRRAPVTLDTPTPEPVKAAAPAAKPAQAAPVEKIDPNSDDFFYAFSEMVPVHASRNAVKCYEDYTKGGRKALHRNQSIVLGVKHRIVNGKVTIADVWVKKSSITRGIDDKDRGAAGYQYDTALESCFIQQVRNTSWFDERLPDMPLDEDEITLSPERGLKKYRQDNINYEGIEGPQVGTDGKPINTRPEHTGGNIPNEPDPPE